MDEDKELNDENDEESLTMEDLRREFQTDEEKEDESPWLK